jgi:ABC-type uncharacterized transport system permease subunit
MKNQNPCQHPASSPGRRIAAVGLGLLSIGLFVLTTASGAVFLWAVDYHLRNTDFMGQMMVPPPIPVKVANYVALGTFFLTITLLICLGVAVRATYLRLTGRDHF